MAGGALALLAGCDGRHNWLASAGAEAQRVEELFWVLLLGAALFAATLYAMALGAPRWFGAITPIGGLGMLAGWAMIAWAALKA